jgi:hypothetical protein
VLHNCPGGDDPCCVKPSHLWTGTQAENMRDKARKGRSTRSWWGERYFRRLPNAAAQIPDPSSSGFQPGLCRSPARRDPAQAPGGLWSSFWPRALKEGGSPFSGACRRKRGCRETFWEIGNYLKGGGVRKDLGKARDYFSPRLPHKETKKLLRSLPDFARQHCQCKQTLRQRRAKTVSLLRLLFGWHKLILGTCRAIPF